MKRGYGPNPRPHLVTRGYRPKRNPDKPKNPVPPNVGSAIHKAIRKRRYQPLDVRFDCPYCNEPWAAVDTEIFDIHCGTTYPCKDCGNLVVFLALTREHYAQLEGVPKYRTIYFEKEEKDET